MREADRQHMTRRRARRGRVLLIVSSTFLVLDLRGPARVGTVLALV